MSATSWSACPKCLTPEEQEQRENNESGNLREDYECGFFPKDRTKLHIYYNAECQDCGYTKDFEHKEPM